MLSLCLACNARTTESVKKLLGRYCRCNRTPANQGPLPHPSNAVGDDDNDSQSWGGEGHYEPDDGYGTSGGHDDPRLVADEPSMGWSTRVDGMDDMTWPGHGQAEPLRASGSDAGVHGGMAGSTDRGIMSESEVRRLFGNRSEYPQHMADFLLREHLKEGDGRRGLVYQTLIDPGRQSHFGDLDDDEMNHHLHILSLHHGITQSKRKDVCGMTDRIVSEGRKSKAAEVSAQSDAFVESIKRRLGDHCDPLLLESVLKEVKADVKAEMDEFHINQAKRRKISQPTDYNRIRSKYVESSSSMLHMMPMPEVNILHGCAHIPANQSANLLLALCPNVDIHRAGYDEDWTDERGNYKCQLFWEVHGRVKTMMRDDPQNVTRDARVVFVRPWSDGFEAHKIKAKNAYNNLQLFTLTLRTIGGKGKKRHTLPFGLCFKKESHAKIFMQLLEEVTALEVPTKRYFGQEKRFYTTIICMDMISADYPERCANAIISQLGLFTHRWGFSCIYNDGVTPSCRPCELARIERLLCGEATRAETGTDCSGCTDWWSDGRFGVHVNAKRYPIAPGHKTPEPAPAVEITFEMLVNSMDDLQTWYSNSVSESTPARKKGQLLTKAKAHLNRLGITASLVPLLV